MVDSKERIQFVKGAKREMQPRRDTKRSIHTLATHPIARDAVLSDQRAQFATQRLFGAAFGVDLVLQFGLALAMRAQQVLLHLVQRRLQVETGAAATAARARARARARSSARASNTAAEIVCIASRRGRRIGGAIVGRVVRCGRLAGGRRQVADLVHVLEQLAAVLLALRSVDIRASKTYGCFVSS